MHGESGDGSLVRALSAAGHTVHGIEPRAERVWAALDDGPEIGLGEVEDQLLRWGDGELAGVVLSGCTDRLGLAGQLHVAELAVRKTAVGATVAVLSTDPTVWTDTCPVVAQDLLPGRPLHPETWAAILERLGLDEVRWHRAEGGDTVHAVVGRRR